MWLYMVYFGYFGYFHRRQSLAFPQCAVMADVVDNKSILTNVALALAAASVTISAALIQRRHRRKRRFWVRQMFLSRFRYGAYELLMAELREVDEEKYRGFVRFTPAEFDELLSLVRKDISGSCKCRLPIPADIRWKFPALSDWLKQLKPFQNI